jgi:DNA topoisomerase-1
MPLPEDLADKLGEDAKPAEKKEPEVTNIKCEECGAPMVIRTSTRGKFLGCSKYPKCRHTQSLPPEEG